MTIEVEVESGPEVRCYGQITRWSMAAATVMLWLVTILVVIMFASSGWNAPMAIIAMALIAVSTAGVLKSVAMFLNTTRIEFDRGELIVITGPFPWTTRRAIQTDIIEQIYVHGVSTSGQIARRLSGPFDVVARLRDGTWQTIIRGCRDETEAKSVDRWIEKRLQTPNEYGSTDDAERSEVFTQWRSVLGTTPKAMSVYDDGERLVIRYRASVRRVLGALAIAIAVGTIGVWIVTQTSVVHLGFFIWCLIITLAVGNSLGLLFGRQIITIDNLTMTRRATWSLWYRRPVEIPCGSVTALDCRSRIVRYRRGKFGTFYKRRYWVQATANKAGTFEITHSFHDRNTALHIMKLIADKLEIEPRPTSG